MRRGRKVDAERKFFPGYVLVKMDMTDQAYHLIKNTPKVTGFLGSDDKPMPISEKEAEPSCSRCRKASSIPSPPSPSRSASRCASPTVRSPLQRRGRGSRRGARAPQGGSFDFRPCHAGRAGIRTGREGLIRHPGASPGASWKGRVLGRTASRTTKLHRSRIDLRGKRTKPERDGPFPACQEADQWQRRLPAT